MRAENDKSEARERPKHAANDMYREDHWPEGVYTISIDSMNNMGVDKDGTLYWDGALIKTTRKITLDTQERVIAWVVAAATVVGAIATAVQAWDAVMKP